MQEALFSRCFMLHVGCVVSCGDRPVLITDVVPHWPASNWSRDFFVSRYGSQRVTMKAVDVSLTEQILSIFRC